MRNDAIAILLGAVLGLTGSLHAYDKPAKDSLLNNTAGIDDQAKISEQDLGVLEETPNQRRARLGEAVVASYPTSDADYGVREETPNERRVRLGLPTPLEMAEGQVLETPNQRRERLASAENTARLP